MSVFSVLLFTAPPPGQPTETGGAYAKIDGREAVLRSVELFLNRDNVKQIQLAIAPEMMEEAKRKFGGHLGFSGVKMVSGGPRWIDQIVAAGEKLASECSHVIVHDAARPAVPYSDIDALMDAAGKSAAATLAAPLRSALVEVDEGGNSLAFHPASQFLQLLTPQVFTKAVFLEMAKTRQEPHASKFAIVKGSALNVRAGSTDSGFVKSMINMLPKPKVKALSSPFEEAQW